MRKIYFLTMFTILFSGIMNAQIVQVTDINATGNAGIGTPGLYNGEIYFEADDGIIGDELYKVTADGSVVLVKDINTDELDTSPNGDPKYFTEYKGLLYFNGNDGDDGADLHDSELWVTDGTTDGTQLVADIWPGGDGNASNPMEFFVFNEKLYFLAKGTATSSQIWRYDGVNAPVKITSWREDGFATSFFPCVDEANGKVYLKANDGKYQLGVINADETSLMITVGPADNAGFAGTEAGVIYNGKYYYDGDNGTDGDELFVSDGTVEGTSMLKDINVGGDSDPEQFTEWNGELYFIAEVATGMQLWKTDGTADGTVMVAEPFVGGDADMDYLTLFNDKLYFAATDGTNGVEVWSYDGTTASMVKDLDGDVTDSNPEGFIEVDGLLFFAADDLNGETLWVTDGTEGGTLPVDSIFLETAIPEDVAYGDFIANGSMLYFSGDDANGDELFMVDAKSIKEAINQATDINKDGDSGIATPTAYNGEVYFEADDGVIGDELYKITADGSVVLVKDINTDELDTSPNGDPKYFTEYKGLLYFNGNDGDKGADLHDSELWVTDGTTDGTTLVADIWPGGDGNASNPMEFFVFNDNLYFLAKGTATSSQIWRYDGVNAPEKITSWREDGFATSFFPCVDEANGKVYLKANDGKYQLGVINADETSLMITVGPADNAGFAGTEAGVIYNGKYYYDGDNGTDGDELFVSDGTVEGTSMLKDIYVGGDSDPEQFTEWNGELYFIAEVATGMQLWKTDGTADGTVMVAEPNVGGDGQLDFLTLYNDMLFFAANDGTNGIEIWTYDGTTAAMLKDLDGDVTDSDPEGFKEVDGLLFFTANDSRGETLWVTNGEADYTVNVAEALNQAIQPVKVNYREFASVGSILYYTADDANGYDDIYSVDAKLLFSEDVSFSVTDENGPLADATVEFDGTTATTDAEGMVTFEYVRMGADLAYTVSLEDYETLEGTVTVADGPVAENVTLIALPTYNVTFTVTDGTNAIQGAEIAFNGITGTTDASGVYTFAEVLPAADLAYTITLTGYEEVTGTATVVDADVNVDETMTLIVFTVTFNVTDGSNALEGATVNFNSEDKVTDASGTAVFSDVVPGTGVAYMVTLDYRYYDEDGTVDVDGDETVDVVMALTAVEDAVNRGIDVYPNPTSGPVNISGVHANAVYEIYNVSQQKIAAGILDGARIDLNTEPGLYILKIVTDDQSFIQRIIVE